jgi:hypothetical protein
LNFTGTRQIASLSLSGVSQANGSYGSTASPATYKNDTFFAGTGTVTVGPVATMTVLSSNFNPAAVSTAVTLTATVTGSMPTGEVTFYDGATLLGTSALNATFQASITTSDLLLGDHRITATYAGNSSNLAHTSTTLIQVIAVSGYETWAANGLHGLTLAVNDSPSADPDGDGISNLMEFALGGAPMKSSTIILPTLRKSGDFSAFEYDRNDAATTSTQVVMYGNNLVGWTSVTIPATSQGIVEITPGSPSDRVKVTLPNLGPQIFVRLKVTK